MTTVLAAAPPPNERVETDGASPPSRGELLAVMAAGAGHVAVELALSGRAAIAYNVAVSLLFLAYLVWRFRSGTGVARAWGMRRDNLAPAARAHGALAAVAAAGLVGWGLATGGLYLPATFWMTLVIYPVWGLAQQFALQNLVARNLAGLIRGEAALALVAAAMFALAHYPRLELVVLTLGSGFVLTLVYRRFPNLWVVGVTHGLLGSLTFYVVLRQDPGRALLEWLAAAF